MADSSESEFTADSSDSSSYVSGEDYESSSSPEESVIEEEAEIEQVRVISRPSSSKRKSCKPRPSATTKSAKKKKNYPSTNSSLLDDELDELTSWIFSTEQAAEIKCKIRSQLLEHPRVNEFSERLRFAKHLLSESQKPNFQLMILGFCRKFSSLVDECAKLPDKKNRKAAFSVAWMKMLANFTCGKPTQERSVVERFSVGQQFADELVHGVFSVLHEMVYTNVLSQIQQKKVSSVTSETTSSKLSPESEETLYRYCGAALHRMTKLRTETLQQKKGRGKVSAERRATVELELELLKELTMKDKSLISSSLQNLHEGNLVFPRTELIPFLTHVDDNVREFTSDSNLKKYPTKFIDMCQSSVLNNEELEEEFSLLVASIVSTEAASNSEVVGGIFKALVSKLANTRINEFMNAKTERDLKSHGKVVDADEMLRPKLKADTLSTKRK